jgi:aryl-alcohol dehydrogenase-like predicted oxidoreductase
LRCLRICIYRVNLAQNQPVLYRRNFKRNLQIIDEVKAVAAEAAATPAQVAPAWLLAQDNDIARISETKRVVRVEENTAADRVELTVRLSVA